MAGVDWSGFKGRVDWQIGWLRHRIIQTTILVGAVTQLGIPGQSLRNSGNPGRFAGQIKYALCLVSSRGADLSKHIIIKDYTVCLTAAYLSSLDCLYPVLLLVCGTRCLTFCLSVCLIVSLFDCKILTLKIVWVNDAIHDRWSSQ